MDMMFCLGASISFADITEGKVVILFIGLASLIGMAFTFYSFLILRRGMILPRDLLDIVGTLDKSEESCAGAETLCRKEGGPFAEVLLAAIMTRKADRDDAIALVESAGRRAAHSLSSGPLVLEVVAAIAPLLGLLGTVIGMKNAFAKITITGVKEIGMLSGPIGSALDTTIYGLVVAIPAFIAYSYFSRRVDDLVLEMERHAIRLMAQLRSED